MSALLKALKNLSRSPRIMKLLSSMVGRYIQFVLQTSTWRFEGLEHFYQVDKENTGFILAFWHQRLMLSPVVRYKTERPAYMLISRHRDGEVIAAGVARFDLQFIRGSSNNPKKDKNKSGVRAMSQMIEKIEEGAAIGMTVDGPRGPAFVAKPGAVRLAGRTGCAILPGTFAVSNRITLKNWDTFHVALPFSRGAFVAGEPIYIKDNIEGEDLTAAVEQLTQALKEATIKAEKIVSSKEEFSKG